MKKIKATAYYSNSAKEDRDDLLVYKEININELERNKVLGIPIDNVSRDDALACVLNAIENKKGVQHIFFIDPLKLIKIKFNKKLRNIINSSFLVLAEGSGIPWSARMLGTQVKERISISAMIMDLLRLAMNNDFTVYLLGSKPEYLQKVFFNFQRSFPNIRIIGRQPRINDEKFEVLIKESIRKSSPDIILLSMDFPYEEYWIHENKSFLNNSIVVSVDDAFEILSGLKKKSPDWINLRGFNWLWNCIKNPWNIFSIVSIFYFYIAIILKGLKQKFLKFIKTKSKDTKTNSKKK